MSIPSYGRIRALGHREIADLLKGDVVAQEKIDGSQVSFMVKDGVLHARSKGATIDVDAPPNLFAPAVETFKRLHAAGDLNDGYVLRGEAVCKPKHNTLTYDRAPAGGVILFDVGFAANGNMDVRPARLHAELLGLEFVREFYRGPGSGVTMDRLNEWLDTESSLGGPKVEGVVIKSLHGYGVDGHPLMGKYVSEAFKEAHSSSWRQRHPTRSDVVTGVIDGLRTEARWRKAVQHLDEAGLLQNAPQDIGPLMAEVSRDVLEDCGDEIREVLFKHFWKRDISRGVARGLADWYKRELASRQLGLAADG